MTLECGVRFLTDYLSGDTYFRVHREGHNLDRCRTQFKLVEDMEQKRLNMGAIIETEAAAAQRQGLDLCAGQAIATGAEEPLGVGAEVFDVQRYLLKVPLVLGGGGRAKADRIAEVVAREARLSPARVAAKERFRSAGGSGASAAA